MIRRQCIAYLISTLCLSLYARTGAQQISFGRATLAGTNFAGNPTSLQFGPDGRLYVSQQDGEIKIFTIVRNAANNYSVSATEIINQIKNMPNRNDDGTLNSSIVGRQVTGILVTGTAQNPVLYVGSSDPRIATGSDSG